MPVIQTRKSAAENAVLFEADEDATGNSSQCYEMLVSFGRYNISTGKLNMTTQTQELKWQSGEMGSPNLCRSHSSLIGQGNPD